MTAGSHFKLGNDFKTRIEITAVFYAILQKSQF